MSSRITVLVTGATGMAGFEVVRRLAENPDLEVWAALHSPDKRSLLPAGVSPVAFDNSDPALIDAAMRGVDRLFLLTPGGPTGPAANRLIAESARRHGVQRIAKLSSFMPEREPRVPTDVWALEVESILGESGIPCTFLQPPWFNQNFTRGHFAPMLAHGLLALPFGTGRCGWVDTRDIAAMTEKILLEDGHAGKSYTPTGPEQITLTDIAAVLSEITGKEITYRAVNEEEWVAMALAHGEPEDFARAGFSLMNKTAEGHVADVTDDCERVTGSPARSFRDFARDHADLLRALANHDRA